MHWLLKLLNQFLPRSPRIEEWAHSDNLSASDRCIPTSLQRTGKQCSLEEWVREFVEAENPSAAKRFDLLRVVGKILVPGYRFHWPQLQWWHDQAFNEYLRRFGELDGMNTERRWMLWQLLRLVEDVPGETAECGVYTGASSYLMCLANRQSRLQRWHFLFDSFAGLSQPSALDGTHWTRGDLACGLDEARQNLADFEKVKFYPGWIPQRFAEIARHEFAFVHIDVDLYEPTRDSIAFFYAHVSPGGIILCDDYGFTTCPGATKASDDFFRDKPEKMIALPCGGGFMIKGCPTLQLAEDAAQFTAGL
jgi:hypothetical protein